MVSHMYIKLAQCSFEEEILWDEKSLFDFHDWINKQTNLKDNTISYLSSIEQCSGDLSPQLVYMGIFQIINPNINKLFLS